MLLFQFRQARRGLFQFCLLSLNGALLLGKVASYDQRLGDQIAGPALISMLPLFVGLDNSRRQRHPAIGGDQIAIVLHGRSPIVHEVLVDVVVVEQGGLSEGRKEVFGEGSN